MRALQEWFEVGSDDDEEHRSALAANRQLVEQHAAAVQARRVVPVIAVVVADDEETAYAAAEQLQLWPARGSFPGWQCHRCRWISAASGAGQHAAAAQLRGQLAAMGPAM